MKPRPVVLGLDPEVEPSASVSIRPAGAWTLLPPGSRSADSRRRIPFAVTSLVWADFGERLAAAQVGRLAAWHGSAGRSRSRSSSMRQARSSRCRSRTSKRQPGATSPEIDFHRRLPASPSPAGGFSFACSVRLGLGGIRSVPSEANRVSEGLGGTRQGRAFGALSGSSERPLPRGSFVFLRQGGRCSSDL